MKKIRWIDTLRGGTRVTVGMAALSLWLGVATPVAAALPTALDAKPVAAKAALSPDGTMPTAMTGAATSALSPERRTPLTAATAAGDERKAKLSAPALTMNDIPRMIYTTEPAVAYVFAGLSKPEVVRSVLTYLQENGAKGTFFITERDIRRHPKAVAAVIHSDNEVAIGIQSLKNSTYDTTVTQIRFVRDYLKQFGRTTDLVMQPMGVITDDTCRAISDEGCVVYRPTLTMVSSRHKAYTSADDVMREQFGRFTYAVGRGWIVYFRLDYYNDDALVVKVMDLVKRHKIDPVAYYSVYDDPAVNSRNDSAYRITSIGDILSRRDRLYTLAPHKAYATADDYRRPQALPFTRFLAERYIGNPTVQEDNLYGFSEEEKRYRDDKGFIHAREPVVFFTFDDFGSDRAINHLLYVFRKHRAKGTFFVLTKNVLHNPNIVRAIAEEGHDVASHSEEHRAMDKGKYRENYERYLVDYGVAAAKLRAIVGDVTHPDGSSAYRSYFRPPTLSLSRAGAQALADTGYEYIVAGSSSTHDYKQTGLNRMIEDIKAAVFDKEGRVKNGAVLVMHMSDQAMYTAQALDVLMTENDKRPDGDPAKFIAVPLSLYLDGGYRQDDTASGRRGDDALRRSSTRASEADGQGTTIKGGKASEGQR